MVIKIKNKKKQILNKTNLITFVIFLIFILIISFWYIKEQEKKEKFQLEKKNKIEKELLLKQEQEKKSKVLEDKILEEVKKVLVLFNVSSDNIKIKIVEDILTFTCPKNVETEFLKVRYGEKNIKIINNENENFVYIFINMRVFNKDYVNQEEKKEEEKEEKEEEKKHTESTVKSSETPTIKSASWPKRETDKTKALQKVF